jgi:hypothetical protein
MKPTLCLLSLFALTAPARLSPQELGRVARPTSHVARDVRATWDVKRATVHWGKWLAAAGAVAFTLMGSHEHENANREFERLLAVCRADTVDCLLGPDGRYANPASERLYQTSIGYDRRARVRLIAGQASLLVAAGLFVADLQHEGDGPGNKPFAPLEVSAAVQTACARVGLRWAF